MEKGNTILTKTDPSTFSILAVDDNLNALEVIQRNLRRIGYTVHTLSSVDKAVAFLKDHSVDLVITDHKMPKQSGMNLIQHVRENYKDTVIIMITGYASIDGAVQALKKGAEEYLPKPFTDTELRDCVDQVIEKIRRRREVHTETPVPIFEGIVGNSPMMQQVYKLITRAANMTANVLISGESGTGKELVARAIHYGGVRASEPFVPVNCTAIPDSLLESELFGHVKGAFTGAKNSRQGFFQIADGGTIFLDEIGDASLKLQAKLLRTIQSKEFFRVGESKVSKVDIRIIAATHKDLPALAKKKLFREDLYYRLNVIDIHIPALRERGQDILQLINHFMTNFCREINRVPPSFSDDALKAMLNYSWPGNIRELENLIQRLLVIVDEDRIEVSDLPENMHFFINHDRALNRTLKELEAEHILNVLSSTGGNKTKAATILGIDRKTLREKLKAVKPED
jgi:DNA-binding NtrC family response regulator